MKDKYYYIKLVLLAPLWALSMSPIRKRWAEFKSGLIKHECKFGNEVFGDKYYYKHCTHLGCYMCYHCDKNGNEIKY